MKGCIAVFLVWAFLLAAGWYLWFYDPPPSKEDVIGVFTGSHGGYVDRVELTNNYRFSQTLKTPDGKTLKSSGTWRLRNRGLVLEGYIFFIEEQMAGSSDQPVRTAGVIFAAYQGGTLIRDWGIDFYKLSRIQKRSPEEAVAVDSALPSL